MALSGSSVNVNDDNTGNGEEICCVLNGPEATKIIRDNAVLELLIQAADVAHTMQNWPIFVRWSGKLYEELKWASHKRCGDDPLSGWYSGQISFFDNYVIPIASKLHSCGIFGEEGDIFLQEALKNKERWLNEGKAITLKQDLQFSRELRLFEDGRRRLSPKINCAA